MATQTPNYNFDLREGTDIFNPLSSNSNWESLDTLLKTIQETSGITTYTTTASANLLKLSGTPVANDTVFKFVAADNANTWTAASGGVINNIVGLNGVQMTIKGGNMYVAWINSANAMVCVVWPDVVNAQTFDGKGPDEWATKVQLDAVNTTAGNATQTAQAAATVANQALATAQAAGLTMKKVWTNPTGGSNVTPITLGTEYENAKFFLVMMKSEYAYDHGYTTCAVLANITGIKQPIVQFTTNSAGNLVFSVRGMTLNSDGTITVENGKLMGTSGDNNNVAFPTEIYAIS